MSWAGPSRVPSGLVAGERGRTKGSVSRTSPPPARVVVVAASTGGPSALARLLPALPADLEVPVLVVQHLPAGLEEGLAARLDRMSSLAVAVATRGQILRPGHVLLAPGWGHLEVELSDGVPRAEVRRSPPVRCCRPSADVLFASAAEAYGASTLGLVLTGMGRDGLDGSRRIHARGGRVFVQDRTTSAVWGMPGVVARAGLACEALPLPRLAAAAAHACARGSSRAA